MTQYHARRHAQRGHRDANEPEIREALAELGVKSWLLSGNDLPDLLCLKGSVWFLAEVKNPKGLNRLSEGQRRFMAEVGLTDAPLLLLRSRDDVLQEVAKL